MRYGGVMTDMHTGKDNVIIQCFPIFETLNSRPDFFYNRGGIE